MHGEENTVTWELIEMTAADEGWLREICQVFIEKL